MPFAHTNHTENIPHHPYHTFQNKKREVGGGGGEHRCTPRFYLSSKRESHMWLIKKEEKEKKTEVGRGGGSGRHFVPGCPAALHIT